MQTKVNAKTPMDANFSFETRLMWPEPRGQADFVQEKFAIRARSFWYERTFYKPASLGTPTIDKLNN